MGIGAEGEAIPGVVVATFGVLVDVGGLDHVACRGLETVAGEGAGVFVAGTDFGFEAVVPALFLAGLVGLPVFGKPGHFGSVWNGQAEAFAEADLFCGGEVSGDHDPAGALAETGILQAGEEVPGEIAEAGGES